MGWVSHGQPPPCKTLVPALVQEKWVAGHGLAENVGGSAPVALLEKRRLRLRSSLLIAASLASKRS